MRLNRESKTLNAIVSLTFIIIFINFFYLWIGMRTIFYEMLSKQIYFQFSAASA